MFAHGDPRSAAEGRLFAARERIGAGPAAAGVDPAAAVEVVVSEAVEKVVGSAPAEQQVGAGGIGASLDSAGADEFSPVCESRPRTDL